MISKQEKNQKYSNNNNNNNNNNMENNFDLRKFLMENRKPVNEIDADLLKRAQNTPAPKDAAEKLAQRKKEQDGVLRVSMGSNAEQEQKVIDIARDAIALMDEQPGTSAIDALQTVIEFM